MKSIFSKDPDIIGIKIFNFESKFPTKEYAKQEFLETYGFLKFALSVDDSSTQSLMPRDQIVSEGEAIWN